MSIAGTLANPFRPVGAVVWLLIIALIIYVHSVTNVSTPPFHQDNSAPLYLMTAGITADEMRILEVLSGHAWQNHGSEVNQAIKCLEDNGTYKSYFTRGFKDERGNTIPTNLWLCKDKNGDFFAVVTTYFEKVANNQVARLVTAYKVASDIFPQIGDFIKYIVDNWGAKEINYVIEKGQQIFLSAK